MKSKRKKTTNKVNYLYYPVFTIYKLGRLTIFSFKLILNITSYLFYCLFYFLKTFGELNIYLTSNFLLLLTKSLKEVLNLVILTGQKSKLIILRVFTLVAKILQNAFQLFTKLLRLILITPGYLLDKLIKGVVKLFIFAKDRLTKIKASILKIYRDQKKAVVIKSKKIQSFKRTQNKISFNLTFAILLMALISVVSFYYINSLLKSLPDPKSLSDTSLPASTLILDKNNTLLYNYYSKEDRVPVSLASVPKIFLKATVYSEDSRFYTHFGIDPIALSRAFLHNLTHKDIEGGSTITQQLAKTIYLSPDRSLNRKIEEALLALRIEHNLSKNQILELYINSISYGGNTRGIESAAQHYFGVDAKDLTPKESIYLASITSAPNYYANTNSSLTLYKIKEQEILNKLLANHAITKSQKQTIENEKLTFIQPVIYKRAPHATDYAIKQLPSLLPNNDDVSKGLLVHTTIDLKLQNFIQKSVLAYISKEQSNNITNAGVIVVNPRNGAILAMVGSANYFNGTSGQYNTVLANRQLGSAVKIITYSLALDTSYKPTSIIVDQPTSFKGFPDYNPRNYDGKFHGSITLKDAFANSYNIPALKVAYSLGLRNVANLGVEMGIPELTFKNNNIPLSFVIGGVEMPLSHLANAYSIVANDGKAVDMHIISSITDYKGNTLYQYKNKASKQIISQQTAENIFNILSDNNARLPAFGHSSDFEFGSNKIAIKTGTSNDDKDNVAMAFSKDLVVGVWVGNNNGESMDNIASGYVGATNIMHTVVNKELTDLANTNNNSKISIK